MSIQDAMDGIRSRIDGYLPHGSLRRRLVRGTFWSMVGTVIAQGLGLAATIVVGRVLGKEGFGELGMIRSTIGMVGTFAGSALGVTANKHVAEYRAADPQRAGRIIGLSTLMASSTYGFMLLALLVSAPYLAAHTLAAPKLAPLIQMGCVMLFFDGLKGTQTGALSGFEAFKTIARVNLIQGVATFPLMVAGVLLWGLEGAVLALTCASILGWAVVHWALRREARKAGVPISYRGLSSEFPVLWKFWLPAYLGGIMYGPVFWAANAILVNSPSGYAALGVFSAANQWQMPVLFLSTQIAGVLLPILASFNLDRAGEARSERVLEGTYSAIMLLTLPFVAILTCLAIPIIALYGRQFAEAVPVLSAVLFVSGLRALGTVGGTAITSKGAMWSGFALNASWGVLLLLFVWLWADRGAMGFANAFAAAYFVLSVGGSILGRQLKILSGRLALGVILASVALGAVTYVPELLGVFWLRIVAIPFAVAAAFLCASLFGRNSPRALLAGIGIRAKTAPDASAVPADAAEDASACPVCGGESRPDGVVLAGYAIQACDACSHRFAFAPQVAGEGYEALYADGAYKESIIGETLKQVDDDLAQHPTYRPFFERIDPKVYSRLLDVACGTGRFCRTAQQRGWQVTGCDVSPTAISVASTLCGGCFVVASLEEAGRSLKEFDVTTAFEFVEHTANPLDTVEKLKRFSRPGGLVLVTVPCWDSREVKTGRDPTGCPPLHLQFFTRTSLERLMREAGFENVQVGVIRPRPKVVGPRSLLKAVRCRFRPPLGLFAVGTRPLER